MDEIEKGMDFGIKSYAIDSNNSSKLVWDDATDDYLEMLDELREAMKNREDEVTVVYHADEVVKNAKDYLFALAVLYDSYVHTGDPAGGDYLYHNMSGTGLNSEVVECEDGGSDIYITFYFNWRTTATEETMVSIVVDSVINSFDWDDSTSDYEKITDIYEWIVTHVTYDYDAYNSEKDGSIQSYPAHTAYGPLIKHTGVCEGVAITFYRMALTAGIDCRAISGVVTGGSHLWNIIELDGIYYNVDATWDLGAKDISKYHYYLKGSTNFDKSHTRSSSYKSDFDLLYPTSETDYPIPLTHTYSKDKVSFSWGSGYSSCKAVFECTECGEKTTVSCDVSKKETAATCTSNGKITYTAEASLDGVSASNTITTTIQPTGHVYGPATTSGLTKKYTCKNCGNVKTVYIDGLFKDSSGSWYYYKDGKVDTSYTGFAENSNGKWYVENGKVTFKKQGIIKDTAGALGDKGAWYYVIGSKVQTDFTGLSNFRNQYGWWYIKNGKVDFSHNGVDKNVNGWWYVTGGKVRFDYTGLANYKNQYGWWYIKDGKVDFNHNGVDKNKNGWWYVTGGKVQFGYTGVSNYKNQCGWWYIRNGKVDFTYNGKASNKNGTWNVVGGKVVF